MRDNWPVSKKKMIKFENLKDYKNDISKLNAKLETVKKMSSRRLHTSNYVFLEFIMENLEGVSYRRNLHCNLTNLISPVHISPDTINCGCSIPPALFSHHMRSMPPLS